MNGQWTRNTKMILSGAALLGLAAAGTMSALAQTAPDKGADKGAPAGAPMASAGAAAAAPAEPVKVPVNLTLPSATTFSASCVRCHGVDGTKRASGGWGLTDAKRLVTVTGMMKTRAKLTPNAGDIEAMSSYVQSLKGGSFVEIVNGADFAEGKSEKLTGDATPGAKVTLVKDGKETPITLTKSAWSLDAAPKAPFTIKAVNGDVTAELNFPEKQWATAINPANKNAAPAKGAADKGMDKGAADKGAAAPAKAN